MKGRPRDLGKLDLQADRVSQHGEQQLGDRPNHLRRALLHLELLKPEETLDRPLLLLRPVQRDAALLLVKERPRDARGQGRGRRRGRQGRGRRLLVLPRFVLLRQRCPLPPLCRAFLCPPDPQQGALKSVHHLVKRRQAHGGRRGACDPLQFVVFGPLLLPAAAFTTGRRRLAPKQGTRAPADELDPVVLVDQAPCSHGGRQGRAGAAPPLAERLRLADKHALRVAGQLLVVVLAI